MPVDTGNVVLLLVLVALLGGVYFVYARSKGGSRMDSSPQFLGCGNQFLGAASDVQTDQGETPEDVARFNSSVAELDQEIQELRGLFGRLEAEVASSQKPTEQAAFMAADDTVLVDLDGIESLADEVVRTNDQRRADLQKALESEGESSDWQQESRELVSLIEDLAEIQEPIQSGPVEPDDLKQIRGIGKVLEGVLNEKGIQTFEQLATLSLDDIEALSKGLKHFGNRVVRDRWIEQAQALVEAKAA